MTFDEVKKNSYSLTNDNGNVKVSVRNELRKSAVKGIQGMMSAQFGEIIVATDGGVSVPMGVDRVTGDIIYAHFTVTVNMKEPEPQKEPAKSKSKVKMF